MDKFSLEKIQKARQRLDKSNRGSDEEYYSQLLGTQIGFTELWGRFLRQYKEFEEQYAKCQLSTTYGSWETSCQV